MCALGAWWIKGQPGEREPGVRAEVLTHYLRDPTVEQSVQNKLMCPLRGGNIVYGIQFNGIINNAPLEMLY